MDNVMRIVRAGVCTGCGACAGCEHIQFRPGELGFDTPQVDANCTQCGNCVKACCFDPLAEDDK